MKLPRLLCPTDLSHTKLASRYARHPGPYAITEGWQNDLERIFPGIMGIKFSESDVPSAEYGEMNQSETELIYRIVTWLEPLALVELGTFYGRSTRIMAEQSPATARVLTVDLPEGENPAVCSTDGIFAELAWKNVGRAYMDSNSKGKITQLRMDAASSEFEQCLDSFLDGGSIDFALIDAAHDYCTTSRLFGMMHKRMSPGGVIIADDYNKLVTHVGVTECFAEKAREEGFLFYYFKPFPSNAKDPSALFFVNLEGAVRDWRK